MRLVHVSDLHFGPHYRPAVGDGLLSVLTALQPEAVIVTGDLTQRARHNQFQDAAKFLKRAAELVPEVVVCPGNHDIALYRFWERIFYPFARYQKYIHLDLDRVVDLTDARVVALNSVRPLSRIVQGKLSLRQHRLCEESFSVIPPSRFRLLALHHPVGMPDDLEKWADKHNELALLCCKQKIDIVLTGHIHQSVVKSVAFEAGSLNHRTLFVGCGTSTSGRGRGDEEDKNTFHYIHSNDDSLSIATYCFKESGLKFEAVKERAFTL